MNENLNKAVDFVKKQIDEFEKRIFGRWKSVKTAANGSQKYKYANPEQAVEVRTITDPNQQLKHSTNPTDHTMKVNKLSKNKLPTEPSQLQHIFRKAKGHLSDTEANRKEILRVANTEVNFVGESLNNHCKWYAEIQDDGSQIWVKVHGNVISNAGKNTQPRGWNFETGFDRNPKKE